MLAVAAIGANLPFLCERLFIVGPRRAARSLTWRLLELLLWTLIALGVGMTLEARIGQVHPQGWEFYAAMASFFLTLAFPGFVCRYLLRGR